jgi:hypothetical protein
MPAHKKLTPQLQEKVVAMIRGGNYIETAAAAAGISKQTLYTWLKNGARAEEGPEYEFAEAVHQALAQAEVRNVLLIGEAAKTVWQAAAWRLERMNPERWALRSKFEHSGEIAVLSFDEVKRRISERAARRSAAALAAGVGGTVAGGTPGNPEGRE